MRTIMYFITLILFAYHRTTLHHFYRCYNITFAQLVKPEPIAPLFSAWKWRKIEFQTRFSSNYFSVVSMKFYNFIHLFFLPSHTVKRELYEFGINILFYQDIIPFCFSTFHNVFLSIIIYLNY